MSAFNIPHLRDILKKEGREYVENMLQTGMFAINIKVDQMSFNKRLGKDGLLIPIARNGNRVLSTLDHIANRHYNDANKRFIVRDVEGLIQTFPVGTEFYFEYFPITPLPSYLQYTRQPDSQLVLSYAKNPKTGVRLPIHPEINPFQVSDSPTLCSKSLFWFHEIRSIMQLAKHPNRPVIKFVRETFPNCSDWLNDYLPHNQIEGLIFFNQNEKVDPKYQVFKIIDSGFEEWKKKQDTWESHLVRMFYCNLTFEIFKHLEDLCDKSLIEMYPILTNASEYYGTKAYLLFIENLTQKLTTKIHKYFWNVVEDKQNLVDKYRFTDLDYELLEQYGILKRGFEECWYSKDIFRMMMFWLSKDRKQISWKSGITRLNKETLNRCVAKIRAKGLIQ